MHEDYVSGAAGELYHLKIASFDVCRVRHEVLRTVDSLRVAPELIEP